MGIVSFRRKPVPRTSLSVNPYCARTSSFRRILVSSLDCSKWPRLSFRRKAILHPPFVASLYHVETCSFRRKLTWERSRRSHDTTSERLEPNPPEIAAIVHGENLDPQDKVQMLSRFGKRCINGLFECRSIDATNTTIAPLLETKNG